MEIKDFTAFGLSVIRLKSAATLDVSFHRNEWEWMHPLDALWVRRPPQHFLSQGLQCKGIEPAQRNLRHSRFKKHQRKTGALSLQQLFLSLLMRTWQYDTSTGYHLPSQSNWYWTYLPQKTTVSLDTATDKMEGKNTWLWWDTVAFCLEHCFGKGRCQPYRVTAPKRTERSSNL